MHENSMMMIIQTCKPKRLSDMQYYKSRNVIKELPSASNLNFSSISLNEEVRILRFRIRTSDPYPIRYLADLWPKSYQIFGSTSPDIVSKSLHQLEFKIQLTRLINKEVGIFRLRIRACNPQACQIWRITSP